MTITEGNQPETQTLAFLQALFGRLVPGELFEVRTLKKYGGPPLKTQDWFDKPAAALEHIERSVKHGDDVYFGVLPRSSRAGGANAVASYGWVWADLDYGTVGHKKPAKFATREEALAAIRALELLIGPATILVDSAGGFHVYWALAEAVEEQPPSVVDRTTGPRVWREAMRRLVHALGADTNAMDPARILRVAGTLNFKPEDDKRPEDTKMHRPVRLISSRDSTVTIAALLALPAAPDQESKAKKQPRSSATGSPGREVASQREHRPFDVANGVPAADVLHALGVDTHNVGSRVYCACPVHGGSNGDQMLVGGARNGASCFGDCASESSVGKFFTCVDLVAGALSLSPRDAVNWIAERFAFNGLGAAREPGGATVERRPSVPDAKFTKGRATTSVTASTPRDFERGDQVELALRLLASSRTDPTEPIRYDMGGFYRYEPERGLHIEQPEHSLWVRVGNYAGCMIQRSDGPVPLSLSAAAITGAIKIASRYAATPGYFNGATAGVAFTNGFVFIENAEPVLRPHSSTFRATHGMPFPFDPNATAPRWLRFLTEIFTHPAENSASPEERVVYEKDRQDRIALIEEWLGAVLLGFIIKYQLCLILIGAEGNNGKSVLLFVMRALASKLHPSAVQSIGPKLWGNVFHLAELAGCRLNVVNEMPDADIEANETFKAVITGDEVNAARKHRDPFTLVPRAGHVFACNTLPGTKDQTEGFWRRWGVVAFERTFAVAERDLTLRDTLIRDELPGIAARVIAAAARLEARGKFVLPVSSEIAKEEWQLESDQVRQFVDECADISPNAQTSLDLLYPLYAAWAKGSGHKQLAKNKLSTRLQGLSLYNRKNNARGYFLTIKRAAQGRYAY